MPKQETLLAGTLLQSIHNHTHFTALKMKYNEALQRLKAPSEEDQTARRSAPEFRAFDNFHFHIALVLLYENTPSNPSIIEDMEVFLNKEQKLWLKETQAEATLVASKITNQHKLLWMIFVVRLARAWGHDYKDLRKLHTRYEGATNSVKVLDEAFGLVAYEEAVAEVNKATTKSKT